MDKTLKNKYNIEPQNAMRLLQDKFFDAYQCPECKLTAKQAFHRDEKTFQNHNSYFSCQCERLSLFPTPRYSGTGRLLVFRASNTLQWIFTSKSIYDNTTRDAPFTYYQHYFYLVEQEDSFTVEHLEADFYKIKNVFYKFDYIPTLAFLTIDKMIKRMEAYQIFQ